jgi:trehalose 6-phosphate phosphatase
MTRSSFAVPQHFFSAPGVEAQCRIARRLLLALDYDGTLVPIAPRPEEARPSSTVVALLSQLAEVASVQVAVMSGRPLAELCALLPIAGITHVGTHGLEIRTATGETRRLMPTGAFSTVMACLRRDVAPLVRGRPGFLLEDKQPALALHYRLARPEDWEETITEFLLIVQAYQRRGITLEVIHGKRTVEVRPLGVNKGKAMQALLEYRQGRTLPVYFGDDATDEDAFRVLHNRGLTVVVADPPRRTSAQYYLRNPEEVLTSLARLLRLRAGFGQNFA